MAQCKSGILVTMEAEKGNFTLPQRNDLRSEARSLQPICMSGFRRGASVRSSPPQRSEESTGHMHVYSAGLRRGARLHSEARSLQRMSTVLDFAAELHCGAHLRSEVRMNLATARNFTAELWQRNERIN